MTKRFHDSNGEAKECRAQKGKCPLGGADSDHVEANSPKEAQELLDAKEAERRGGSFSGHPKTKTVPAMGGDTGYVGVNYDPNRSLKDVARSAQADLKRAKANGEIPKNVDVRVKHFDKINVVRAVVVVDDDDPQMWDLNKTGYHKIGSLKPEYQQLGNSVRDTLRSYNYDKSSPMYDHADFGFNDQVIVKTKVEADLPSMSQKRSHLTRQLNTIAKEPSSIKRAEMVDTKLKSAYMDYLDSAYAHEHFWAREKEVNRTYRYYGELRQETGSFTIDPKQARPQYEDVDKRFDDNKENWERFKEESWLKARSRKYDLLIRSGWTSTETQYPKIDDWALPKQDRREK